MYIAHNDTSGNIIYNFNTRRMQRIVAREVVDCTAVTLELSMSRLSVGASDIKPTYEETIYIDRGHVERRRRLAPLAIISTTIIISYSHIYKLTYLWNIITQ